MNRRIVNNGILVILVLALFLLFLYDGSEELVFSEEAGFYDEPFYLTIKAPLGAKVYYTLDGSDPDENSILYKGAIYIDDASAHDNTYSMRTDVALGFHEEDLQNYNPDMPHYEAPDYLIDKCTVVRAMYIDMWGHCSGVRTASYFVGFQNKEGYEDLSFLSIACDPEDLFGEKGIFVFGVPYEERDEEDKENELMGRYWETNYNYRGKEWERISTVQYFDSDRENAFTQICGVRIQGDGSRARIPRSLNFYVREEYSGNNSFGYDFWGTGYHADAITLFAGGDDVETKYKDALMSELLEDRDFALMHYVPCVAFINGEYWGLYWITEKFDASYLSYYYDVPAQQVIMVKNGTIAEGDTDEYSLYEDMCDFIKSADMTDEDNYARACDMVDMQSFIEYNAVMMYIARNEDWPGANYALWRTRRAADGTEYCDAKWRWMFFDVNSACMTDDLADFDSMEFFMNYDMFASLWENEGFRESFLEEYKELTDTVFEPELIDEKIEAYRKRMQEPMEKNNLRFFGTDRMDLYNDGLDSIEYFFDNRADMFDDTTVKDQLWER